MTDQTTRQLAACYGNDPVRLALALQRTRSEAECLRADLRDARAEIARLQSLVPLAQAQSLA